MSTRIVKYESRVVKPNPERSHLSVLSFKYFISNQKIANSVLCSNVSSNDFKSESQIYGVVPSAKLHISITFKRKNISLM